MWGWESRGRQIAAILLVVGALIALFVFDESAAFWVLVVLALIVAAFDMWEKSRSSSR